MAIELLTGQENPELRNRISKDIAELDELIDELLLASRMDAIDDPKRGDEVDLLALVAEEAAGTDVQVSGSPVRILGDARLLRRLVRNLLDNARRYGRGAIQVRVESNDETKVKLTVIDEGPGVPETERERIFEPFYRPAAVSESNDRGIGLGLALVRQIARRHGGEAYCVPRPGGGTCFEVRLPR